LELLPQYTEKSSIDDHQYIYIGEMDWEVAGDALSPRLLGRTFLKKLL
jgi:hypothetical protein